LPEIKRFINEAAGNYPDLQVQYYGGDPRIKFIISEDGSPLDINPYSHYVESTQGKDLDKIISIVNLNFEQVKTLLKERGVKTRQEVDDAAIAAAKIRAAAYHAEREAQGQAPTHAPGQGSPNDSVPNASQVPAAEKAVDPQATPSSEAKTEL